MKLRIAILIFALVTLMIAAFAETPVSLKITSETSVFTVFYKTQESGKVKLSIFNSENTLVFKEVINAEGSFKRPYNFSALSEGDYTIVLEDKNGKHEEKISYQSEKVVSFIKVNQMVNESDKYVLNVVNNGTENVYVKIYDNIKGLVHEQQIEVTGSYGLVYNLSKVKSSAQSIVIFEVSTSSGKVETAMF